MGVVLQHTLVIGQRLAHRLQMALCGVFAWGCALRVGGLGRVFAVDFAQVLARPGAQVRQDALGQLRANLLPQRVSALVVARALPE